jgi:hypothetical protein
MEDVMSRIFAAITAVTFVSVATLVLSTQANAGARGCGYEVRGAPIAGAYTHGRYGKYEFGYCNGHASADSLPYIPPPYTEHEPAFDGYTLPRGNPNVYYNYPSYRRVYWIERRPYW